MVIQSHGHSTSSKAALAAPTGKVFTTSAAAVMAIAGARRVDGTQLARMLGLNAGTLKNWRTTWRKGGKHLGPRFYRAGRSVRYRLSDVARWEEKQAAR